MLSLLRVNAFKFAFKVLMDRGLVQQGQFATLAA